MSTDPIPHRAVLTVTAVSRPDGGHYLNQADFAAHVAQWVKTDLKDHHAIDQVTVSDRTAELERLRTENARMRHELEVMYGGAFDSLHSAQPADLADLQERIAEVIHDDLTTHGARRDLGLLGIVPRLTDAVLSVLPALVDRAAVLRELIAEAEECDGHITVQELRRMARKAEPTAGTPQPETPTAPPGCWYNAEAAEEAMAAETPGPETQTEARPPTSTWEVESPRRDNWASWGVTYDERDWARERYESAIGNAPARPFRLVRATTTYSVEAEHQPTAETPDAPRREPHPTEADLRHALAVAAKFHGRDATVPVDPAASRTVEYRHTCHDQTSAPGPDYECQWCSTLPESLPAVVAEPGKEA